MVFAQPRFVFFQMMRVPFGDDVEDRAVGRERDVLLESGDAERPLAPHGAGVGNNLTAQDLKQRRLARTVATDQRHALPSVDLQCHLIEERQVAVYDRYAVQG